jgi:hypothetical protein
MVHHELSDPRLLDRSFSLLRPEYRSALRELLSRADESLDDTKPPPLQGKERINDYERGQRMLQLLRSGSRMNPAALRACIEDPEGASDDSCRVRLVRKYLARRFT